MKKVRFCILIVALISLSLFAEESKRYLISDYSFMIVGKTKEVAVRDVVIPSGEEFFNSEESLVEALEQKKRNLLNKRVFSSVEYEWRTVRESKGTIFCSVTFKINSASSFFLFPYAKYDSNYGLKGGTKIYNKNLFGSLTDLFSEFYFQQNDNSFKKGELTGKFEVTGIRIGDKERLALWGESRYHGGNADDSYIKGGVALSDLNFFGTPVGLSSDLKFSGGRNSGHSFAGTEWALAEMESSLSYGPFAMVLGGFSFNDTLRYVPLEPDDSEPLPESGIIQAEGTGADKEVANRAAFRYHGIKIGPYGISLHLYMDTLGSTKGQLSQMEIGESLSMSFHPKSWITLSPSLTHVNYFDPHAGKDGGLMYANSLKTRFQISGSNINWIENFRNGFSFSFVESSETFLSKTFEGVSIPEYLSDSSSLKGSVAGYLYVNEWFNPSARMVGTISRGNGVYMFSEATVGELFRGYLNESSYLKGSKKVYSALAVNLNMTIKAFRFWNWGISYANPFVDFGFVDYDGNGRQWLCSAGIEGIGIVRELPAYPVRISLGVNMVELVQKIRGQIDHLPEYELYMGLDFYF